MAHVGSGANRGSQDKPHQRPYAVVLRCKVSVTATVACREVAFAGRLLLAGGDAFYYAKANIVRNDFNRSVQLTTQDDDASWCRLANGAVVSANDGSKHSAINMPNYVERETEAAE